MNVRSRVAAVACFVVALMALPSTAAAQPALPPPPAQGTDPAADAAQLAQDGLKLLHANHAADAEATLGRALALREQASGAQSPECAHILVAMGEAAGMQSAIARAESYIRRALAIYEKARGADAQDTAATLVRLGEVLRVKGDLDGARLQYERAMPILEKTDGPVFAELANALVDAGVLAIARGDLTGAEPLLLRALSLREKGDAARDAQLPTTLGALATLYRARGDYARAEDYGQRCLAAAEQALGPSSFDVASALLTLGLIRHDKGDYTGALPLFGRARTIFERLLGPDHLMVAGALNDLALSAMALGDLDDAQTALERAVAIFRKSVGARHEIVATALNNLGWVAKERGELAVAEARFQEALSIQGAIFGADSPRSCSTLNNLGETKRWQGDYAAARQFLERALGVARAAYGPNHPTVAILLSNISLSWAGEGDARHALDAMRETADVRERNVRLILATGSETEKLAFMASISGDTDLAVTMHLTLAPDDPAAARLALETILRRKGRTLDATTHTVDLLRQRLDPADRDLFEQLGAARAELSQTTLRGPGKDDPKVHQAQIEGLEAKTRTLEEKLAAASAAFQVETQPVTVEAVQKTLASGAALVELVRYQPFDFHAHTPSARWRDPRYAVYVLRSDGQLRWADLGDAAPLEDAALELRAAAAAPDRADAHTLGRGLGMRLLDPVRHLVDTDRALFVSPDGALNLVPLAALVDDAGHWAVERDQITYVTSGRDLLRFGTTAPSRQGALIVANPRFDVDAPSTATPPPANGASLPISRGVDFSHVTFPPLAGTEAEAKALAATLPDATTLVGAAATKAALHDAHAPRLLHVATHGFFLDAPPTDRRSERGLVLDTSDQRPHGVVIANPLLRSGLALAGANAMRTGDDRGVLTALEASGLDLYGTKLVVLSACETGIGDVKSGEGVYGLRRALVIAGAETLVMSLWKVDDTATRDLMIAYYARLGQGSGRSDALRQVQRAMLADSRTAHPYFWASFIVSGNPTNLEGRSGTVPAVQPGARGCGCGAAGHGDGSPCGWAAVLFAAGIAIRRAKRR